MWAFIAWAPVLGGGGTGIGMPHVMETNVLHTCSHHRLRPDSIPDTVRVIAADPLASPMFRYLSFRHEDIALAMKHVPRSYIQRVGHGLGSVSQCAVCADEPATVRSAKRIDCDPWYPPTVTISRLQCTWAKA